MSGSSRQQLSPNLHRSFSPTERPFQNHFTPNGQNQVNYPPQANGHSSRLPPPPPPQALIPSRSAYYDPVDRSGDVNLGYSRRDRTSSIHSQSGASQRYSYGGESAVGESPQSPAEHGSRGSYPLHSPVSTAGRRGSSAFPQDVKLAERTAMPSEYGATRPYHEPVSPNKSTPTRRGGAMSISALLTAAEEPASNTNPKMRTIASKRQSSDHSSARSPELLRSVGRQIAYRPPVTHSRDTDATDSDHERMSVHASGKKGTVRELKQREYESEDLEQSDSEADSDEFEAERIEYMSTLAKRKIDIAEQENERRKRRRLILQDRLHDNLEAYSKSARDRARRKFFDDAMGKVMKREEEDEKERKKEQQRKRRREKAEADKRVKAQMQAKVAVDVAAREQSERRARDDMLLMRPQHFDRPVLFDEVSVDLTADGQESDYSGIQFDEPKKQRKKPGPKPRKLKELAMAEEPDLIPAEPIKEEFIPHVSKSYNALFDQIWKDIARKEIPKLYRTQQSSLTTKQSNLRKTAQLASKEAQRWKLRTTKNIKDTQARAKRTMREMLTFWKRNEREERDSRRRAEKEAIEQAKKEEEMREAKRQARKLNFLISQTELYSHFIGRKIKTDEVERSTDTDGVAATAETIKGPDAAPHKPPVLGEDGGGSGGVKTWEDVADEDDEALERAARNNAQHAIQAAKDRARQFNEEAGTSEKTEMSNINLDEGEMNFQNPSSLGDIDIEQPKMLTCQLKEYQLKGLNWLCNLYEQGINGILADEMGLGKTVQSISVMAYLAEYHNIWGPFLVIAPASTLHNWQQEIARFVPKLKVIPYWGSAKDRKVLRKFWDRKQLTYNEDSPFHVLITSYQLVVQDTQYFQRMKWQYMILDEAQAIKSSTSSRWKALLGFHCRNRLLLTGTPIQNSMQELWALLHFIMPSLFDSHDEFSEWFSKDIESHAQSNTQLNESQLRRLHMILKPFMLRRVKKHVQKELGDKIEQDVFCNLTYRQRAIYRGLRDKISIMDLIEKAASGGEENTATLMNLVMQFRKVCNHPDLFERADTRSPLSFTSWAETSSFLREGSSVEVAYTVRNLISYRLPALVYRGEGRLDLPGEDSDAGSRQHILRNLCNIWHPEYIRQSVKTERNSAFSWLRFVDTSPSETAAAFHQPLIERTVGRRSRSLGPFHVAYDEDEKPWNPAYAMLLLSKDEGRRYLSETTEEGRMTELLNVAARSYREERLHALEPLAYPSASAPPVSLVCLNQNAVIEQENIMFNERTRRILYGPSPIEERRLLDNKVELSQYPIPKMLPEPSLERAGYAKIQVPSMSRFVSDSGKLAELDRLLTQLKTGGHRVLLYFQMTRMMDLCEEYLTYRHHRYLRLDGSSKLEDRRDMVSAWQTTPEIFVFILSTRAGGLGINLTAADTVIFYDSDWNPTIDSQAMDRAHRLGQTKQVRVYRLITRGTIEERIRMRAQQKEEVQRVVIQGGDPGVKKNVDFKGTREVATWLFDDEDAAQLEKTLEAKEKEVEEAKAKGGKRGKKRKVGPGGQEGAPGPSGKAFNIEDMYHEGEGRFDDSGKPSEAGTPAAAPLPGPKKRGPRPKGNKKKTTQQRLDMIDGVSGDRDVDMVGV